MPRLAIEYDPDPPFGAGTPERADEAIVAAARASAVSDRRSAKWPSNARQQDCGRLRQLKFPERDAGRAEALERLRSRVLAPESPPEW
jgi:hypothetical protein